MWIIDNKTPFAAAGTFTRNIDGAEVWIVAVKATYTLLPNGSIEVAETQESICQSPEYNGEPGVSSLKYETDLIPSKTATDVILHGHAYAPENKKLKNVEVGIRIGSVNKKLLVSGDRHWRRIVRVTKSPIQPFSKIPVVYERAYGGTDTKHKNKKKHGYEPRNPVGTGYARKKAHLKREPMPNITLAGKSFSKKDMPAGFGPIPVHWKPRVDYGGTYDENWEKKRKPLLPKDLDEKYYQYAPEDQQVQGFLKGGEIVKLKNLNGYGTYTFRLPTEKPDFSTLFGSSMETHDSNLHAVIIEPDNDRVMMVWQTALECHNREHLLERTIVKMPNQNK